MTLFLKFLDILSSSVVWLGDVAKFCDLWRKSGLPHILQVLSSLFSKFYDFLPSDCVIKSRKFVECALHTLWTSAGNYANKQYKHEKWQNNKYIKIDIYIATVANCKTTYCYSKLWYSMLLWYIVGQGAVVTNSMLLWKTVRPYAFATKNCETVACRIGKLYSCQKRYACMMLWHAARVYVSAIPCLPCHNSNCRRPRVSGRCIIAYIALEPNISQSLSINDFPGCCLGRAAINFPSDHKSLRPNTT